MELNEAKIQLPVANEKVNGSVGAATTPTNITISPQKSPEDVWDHRTPMLSRMNSMECWDYTIELECLNGPQG
jgi:hypothetical protein